MLRGHRRSTQTLSLGLGALVFCFSAPSVANGRFPAASQLVVERGVPSHLLVSATYGLLVSHDAGLSFSHVCEAAYGSKGTEDAAVAITDGTLLAGLYEGLSVARDGSGCDFEWASGPLKAVPVIDVAIDKETPAHALALTSKTLEGDADFSFDSSLGESTDGGISWHRAGVALPSDLEAFTVDSAPSDPDRVYVSGISVASSLPGIIERSDDRGAHWSHLLINEAPVGSLPFIATVDPKHADTVYVRVTRGTEALLLSTDGAVTWRALFTATSPLLGFALAPDGSKVAVGTAAGIEIADTTDYVFHQVSAIVATCLTWSDAGLYVCAKESTTGFSIGLSSDDGQHFRALYHLGDYCGESCAASSLTGRSCGVASCDPGGGGSAAGSSVDDAGAADAGAADAGTTPMAGGDGTAGAPTDSGSTEAGTPAPGEGGFGTPTQTSHSSCSCGLPGNTQGPGGSSGMLCAALGVLGWRSFRRRYLAKSRN